MTHTFSIANAIGVNFLAVERAREDPRESARTQARAARAPRPRRR